MKESLLYSHLYIVAFSTDMLFDTSKLVIIILLEMVVGPAHKMSA